MPEASQKIHILIYTFHTKTAQNSELRSHSQNQVPGHIQLFPVSSIRQTLLISEFRAHQIPIYSLITSMMLPQPITLQSLTQQQEITTQQKILQCTISQRVILMVTM